MAHSRTTPSNIHRRFWSKVGGMPIGGCWEWAGTRMRQGYGAFWLPAGMVSPGGRMHPAHRVSYYLTTGEWPGELDVCHNCDNPPCVRPGHLWAGTTLENMHDMSLKGRASRVGAPGGERHPRHKLKDAQVAEILRRLALGEGPTGLAREFGVSQPLVSMYRAGLRRKALSAASGGNVLPTIG